MLVGWIAAELLQCNLLTHLCFLWNAIGDVGAAAIAFFMRSLPKLKKFDICYSKLTNDGFLDIMCSIAVTKCVQTLDVIVNRLTEDCLEVVEKYELIACSSLLELHMIDNFYAVWSEYEYVDEFLMHASIPKFGAVGCESQFTVWPEKTTAHAGSCRAGRCCARSRFLMMMAGEH